MGELLALRPLAGCRLRRQFGPRRRQLHRRPTRHAEVGLGRVVPLVDEVAQISPGLEDETRASVRTTSCSSARPAGSRRVLALRRRFKRARDQAGLRPLRFHDLRHTFGSTAIRVADPREVQEWLGHADFSTTQIYMHYKPRRTRRTDSGLRERNPGPTVTRAAGSVGLPLRLIGRSIGDTPDKPQ